MRPTAGTAGNGTLRSFKRNILRVHLRHTIHYWGVPCRFHSLNAARYGDPMPTTDHDTRHWRVPSGLFAAAIHVEIGRMFVGVHLHPIVRGIRRGSSSMTGFFTRTKPLGSTGAGAGRWGNWSTRTLLNTAGSAGTGRVARAGGQRVGRILV